MCVYRCILLVLFRGYLVQSTIARPFDIIIKKNIEYTELYGLQVIGLPGDSALMSQSMF